jgi:16S rRNA (cytosine967-C5)-methyltransferase
MPRQKVDPSRENALKALRRTETALSFPKLLFGQPVELTIEQERDRAFIYQIVMGTLRHRGALDWALEKLRGAPLDELTPWIRNILRMGLYQILYLDRVPKSAAVDESVKLAKKYGHRGTAGLVNAVLRNAQREALLNSVASLGEQSPDDISVKYSHPVWMVELLIEEFGRDAAIEILKNNNLVPPLTARANMLLTTREALVEKLKEEGVRADPLPYPDEAVALEGVSSPQALEAHRSGLLYFQDPSSMLAAHCLEVEPGMQALDVCAAPGGKATHLAALMENKGKIHALDVHEHRVALIEENARRMGASIIEARRVDADVELAAQFGSMDRVIVDVPCSGLGVVRRRLDLKWRLQPDRIEKLARLQSDILERAAECVRPGGLLLYCTCTLTRRENSGVVTDFLSRRTDFKPYPAHSARLKKYSTEDGFIQILPGDDNMDGFFIARLKRFVI